MPVCLDLCVSPHVCVLNELHSCLISIFRGPKGVADVEFGTYKPH